MGLKLKKVERRETITRTIRIPIETYDKIQELADENYITFNNVVNQIFENVLNDKEQ